MERQGAAFECMLTSLQLVTIMIVRVGFQPVTQTRPDAPTPESLRRFFS